MSGTEHDMQIHKTFYGYIMSNFKQTMLPSTTFDSSTCTHFFSSTTFTDHALEDSAEIRVDVWFYTDTDEYGLLFVTIVRYFTFHLSFSFVIRYYLLICDLLPLGRVFCQNFYKHIRVSQLTEMVAYTVVA